MVASAGWHGVSAGRPESDPYRVALSAVRRGLRARVEAAAIVVAETIRSGGEVTVVASPDCVAARRLVSTLGTAASVVPTMPTHGSTRTGRNTLVVFADRPSASARNALRRARLAGDSTVAVGSDALVRDADVPLPVTASHSAREDRAQMLALADLVAQSAVRHAGGAERAPLPNDGEGLRPAVFIDKDGTLIPNVPYNVDPAFILLMPGAREGLPRLIEAGYALVVVTNQSGVARGIYTLEDQARVEARIRELLAAIGVPLTGYYFCPHLETGSVSAYAIRCECRKPEPGLVRRAAEEHGLDVHRSWFVGDIVKDVEAGRRAGCRTILVDRYGEHLVGASPEQQPDYLAGTLSDVADIILGDGVAAPESSTVVSP